ncbi:MAG: hypothetical protein Q8O37_11440 [Sulfuricellaceae bacterium]|nr:hypothetical protein [Sulfuricellaceae bacterium]
MIESIRTDNGMDSATKQATPLHQRHELTDAEKALYSISLAKDALQGIGYLLRPNMEREDGDLHQVKRSQVAAIFEFFGQALAEPVEIASEANHRLWLEAKKISP